MLMTVVRSPIRVSGPWLGRGWVLLAAVGMASCSKNIGGPCIHTFEDPLLVVWSAQDIETGAAIDSLDIVRIRINGMAITDPDYLIAGIPSFNVMPIDAGIRCRVKCGFAGSEGQYDFDVEAEGYQSRTMTVDARYATFRGGCPSSNSGSVLLSVFLNPVR